jgi:hypothetical protein
MSRLQSIATGNRHLLINHVSDSTQGSPHGDFGGLRTGHHLVD